MASSYIQKYPIPQDFPTILKNFTREILRDQPANVIEYSAKYFEALEKGEQFRYKSAYNVPKSEKQYELGFDARKAEELTKKDKRINRISGSLTANETHKINQVIDIIYERYDKDKSGQLDSKQIRTMIQQLYKEGHIDSTPSQIQIVGFISQIDTNKNGKIDKNEIFGFVRNLIM